MLTVCAPFAVRTSSAAPPGTADLGRLLGLAWVRPSDYRAGQSQDRCAARAVVAGVRASRALVTAGMTCAGLPVLGQLASHWSDALILTAVTSWPWAPGLLVTGVACITVGVRTAMRAFCTDPAADLRLPQRFRLAWTDYYTSADPVSIGPVQAPRTGCQDASPAAARPEPGLPRTRRPVYANASVLTGHVSYLRSQDQVLPSVLNDLLAAANPATLPSQVKLVADDDIERARKSRLTLNRMLITARIAVVGLAIALWPLNPGSIAQHPMNNVIRLFDSSASMTAGQARPIAVILITAAVYGLVVIAWRSAGAWLTHRFFSPATRLAGPAAPSANLEHASEEAIPATSLHRSATRILP